MVEAVAAVLDGFLVHAGVVVERLDQFDQHVPGKAHRDGDVGDRFLAAIGLPRHQEVFEHEEWPGLAVGHPVIDRRAQIGHDEGGLRDAAHRLAVAQLVCHYALPVPDQVRGFAHGSPIGATKSIAAC